MNTNFRHWINPIKEELKEHIEDNIQNYTESVFEYEYYDGCENDLHHQLFNEDYYLIGYYNCEQWLKKHGVNIFDGIAFVQEYEEENFGDDAVRIYDNAETLVNMIVYIIGEELIYQDEYHKQFINN